MIIWRFPQIAIYLFLQWLCDVFIGKAVTRSVLHVSESREEEEKNVQLLHSGNLPVCIIMIDG